MIESVRGTMFGRSRAKNHEAEQINNLRVHIGMLPVKEGNRKCLCCEKNFFSEDLANQKCCDNCRNHIKDDV